MDREQGKLFLETLKSLNMEKTNFLNLNTRFNNIFVLLGCYYFTKKTYKYVNNISVYNWIKTIPWIKRYIQKRVDSAIKDIDKEFKSDHTFINTLPQNGYGVNDIKSLQLQYKTKRTYNYDNGVVSGTVYYGSNPDLTNLMCDTVREFIYSNPLHPDVFPDVKIMETEVVNMVKHLFNGNKDTCGNLTSGGTESILMACKTYRDWARDNKNITKPEIVVGESVHGSFLKAGDYFNIKIVTVPVEGSSGKTCIKSMANKINKNTVCIVGSAPSFAHGVIDNIKEMSDLALKHNIGLHVDCCLGGFILPFIKQTGLCDHEFDFQLPGVTSISVDSHKYGNSMKGSSIILYKNKKLRKYQYFINTEWNGGIYATPTIAGSRSGVIVATTWASLLYHGMSGYTELAIRIIKLKNHLVQAIKTIPELRIIGNPATSVIAVDSEIVDIYLVGSKMSEKGWNLNILQNPKAFHICLTSVHVKNKIAEKFIEDLSYAVTYAKTHPDNKKSGTCAIYGMTSTVGDKSIVKEVTCGFLDSLTYSS